MVCGGRERETSEKYNVLAGIVCLIKPMRQSSVVKGVKTDETRHVGRSREATAVAEYGEYSSWLSFLRRKPTHGAPAAKKQ